MLSRAWSAAELLSLRRPRECENEEDVEEIGRLLLHAGLPLQHSAQLSKFCAHHSFLEAVSQDNAVMFRVLRRLGVEIGCATPPNTRAVPEIVVTTARFATFDLIQELRKEKLQMLDSDGVMGKAMRSFTERRACPYGQLPAWQKSASAQDEAAFEAFLDEIRERSRGLTERALCLKADADTDEGGSSEDDQLPAPPGAWRD
ncbi:hypothetical protein F4780DRAFT_165792 [Xylariomycetidae sp. FL0641]|nr:hypothetical protein F4780DRAFT_165792 [Xylariomycetidae sp. FL0641]